MEINAKYINQILKPSVVLLKRLAERPLAIDPESNIILHQFEGLAIQLNHFPEKNGIAFKFSDEFRALSNSIKHVSRAKEKRTELAFAINYEAKDDRFRFVRNTILGKSEKWDTRDSISLFCEELNRLTAKIDENLPKLKPIESIFGFFGWAFSYNIPELASITYAARIQTFEKTANGYTNVDVESVRFVVLGEECIGLHPEEFFPDS